MIEKKYVLDSKHAKQILSTIIEADRTTVFHHLATTDGISAWFPQLSIEQTDDKGLVRFDLGNDMFETMKLLDYQTDEHISYEWATGKIEFQLEKAEKGTKLTLKEELPLSFSAIPEDFTGWHVQMKNIKSVAETGKPAQLNKETIKNVKEDIHSELNL